MINGISLLKEVWPLILRETQSTKVPLVCKLFKQIYEQDDTLHHMVSKELKNRGLTHLLGSPVPLKTSLVARQALHREEATKTHVKQIKDLKYNGVMKLLREEAAINLIHVYKKIPLKDKPEFPDLSIEGQAAKIRSVLEDNKGLIARIEILDLSDNRMTAVPEELALFTGLKSINLSANRIDFIRPSCGKSWEKLEECHLGNNKITSLPAQFGDTWPHLKTFVMDSSKLERLPEGFGSSWQKLEALNLSSNELKELPPNFGVNWRELNSIDLGWNNLQDFPAIFGLTWGKIQFLIHKGNKIPAHRINQIRDQLKTLLKIY